MFRLFIYTIIVVTCFAQDFSSENSTLSCTDIGYWGNWTYFDGSNFNKLNVTNDLLRDYFQTLAEEVCSSSPVKIGFRIYGNTTVSFEIDVSNTADEDFNITDILTQPNFDFRYCCADRTETNCEEDSDTNNTSDLRTSDGKLLVSLDANNIVCGQRSQLDSNLKTMSRIFAGNVAEPNAWPWIVSICEPGHLFDNSCSHMCGGTIIHKRFVLTAAHCFNDSLVRKVNIVAGVNHLRRLTKYEKRRIQRIGIDSLHIHHAYDSHRELNDIALLRLKTPLIYNQYVQPACLPDTESKPGEEVITAGWGQEKENETSPERLIEAKLNIIDHCQSHWPDLNPKRQICTVNSLTGASTCFGDSGGPLLVRKQEQYLLTGISSYVYHCKTSGVDGSPNVFTRVTAYKSWIKSVIGRQ